MGSCTVQFVRIKDKERGLKPYYKLKNKDRKISVITDLPKKLKECRKELQARPEKRWQYCTYCRKGKENFDWTEKRGWKMERNWVNGSFEILGIKNKTDVQECCLTNSYFLLSTFLYSSRPRAPVYLSL